MAQENEDNYLALLYYCCFLLCFTISIELHLSSLSNAYNGSQIWPTSAGVSAASCSFCSAACSYVHKLHVSAFLQCLLSLENRNEQFQLLLLRNENFLELFIQF